MDNDLLPNVVPGYFPSSEAHTWTDITEFGEQDASSHDPLFAQKLFCDYLYTLHAHKSSDFRAQM